MDRYLPKISIVMPSYNQGQFIEESIKSVIEQKYPDFEFIIIDGGSSDQTIEIIKKYERNITYWVSEKDNGQTHAINKGFKVARGDIIAWLNSDDLYLHGALSDVAKYFNKYKDVGLIYGNSYSINEKGEVIRNNINVSFSSKALWSGIGIITQPASFVQRSVLDKIGFLDENLHYLMDLDWFLRMNIGGIKFQKVNKFFCCFRYHSASKTVAQHKNLIQDREFLLEGKHKKQKYIPKNMRNFYSIYFRTKRIVISLPNRLLLFLHKLFYCKYKVF